KHSWRERLNPDDFELGAGDRALVKGGKIHPRYRIMVPSEFVETSTGAGDGP
ncbi:MAG: type IV toxin-antitoxin system AbiEi family antitoxin domain-containing protein, partial [Rhizobiaceae bacterium]|nr:type IV toxin-antitoxin system AbiEi family antitoxin domain-containing protein [Rhizobiaceae bacterium]